MSKEYHDNLPELLSPKVDMVFKLLFGDERSKDITIQFISAVLGYKDGEIEDISFYDPHLKPEFDGDKLEILDIKAKLSNGMVIDVEMQSRKLPDVRSRISYYKANMLTEQIGDGSSYLDVKPVKCIILTDFDFIPESEKCHTVFQLLEREEHFQFNDLEEIHVLNLKKLSHLKNKDLLEWLQFINSKDKEDFMELAQNKPILGKALKVLTAVSADKSNRMLYEARLKAWRDEKSRIDGAMAEGLQKGMQKGYEEVLALLRQGYTVEEVEKRLKLQ